MVYVVIEIGDDVIRENGESKLCLYRGIWIFLELKICFFVFSVVILLLIFCEFELLIFWNFYLVNFEKIEFFGEMVWNLVGFIVRVVWKMKFFD